ncbi:MAG: HDIG domain-containing protein [Jaaginema sp. PMC 1079.18]|nr:HDIG domain-containing protein [Jaaginema sp. PMC 1080.18]MEC4852572.1 HDIG domain-containing protein [Jaaginema sp. PMC 1079.18]MEC4867871.1 HDIG domain-containing protein [Jaaginema sp. PMC 1078.18]
MKNVHSFTERLDGWRRQCHRYWQRLAPQATVASSKNLGRQPWRIPNPVMLTIAVVSLTSVVGYRFYNQPLLKEGTKAPKTYIARENINLINEKATEQQRKEAKNAATNAVLMLQPSATFQTETELQKFIDDVQGLRSEIGDFPYTSDEKLAISTQHFLRSSTAEEWQYIKTAVNQTPLDAMEIDPDSTVEESIPDVSNAIAALQSYQAQAGETEQAFLLQEIEQARRKYEAALQLLDLYSTSDLANSHKVSLLSLSDTTWQQTEQNLKLVVARILAQGIPEGLPEEVKRRAILLQLQDEVASQQQKHLADVLVEIVQPNLVKDPDRTTERALQAEAEIEPVLVNFKVGEAIVRQGEEISPEQFLALDYLGWTKRGVSKWGLASSASLVLGSIGIFWLVQNRLNLRLRCRDRILLCLLSVSTPLLVVFNVPYINLPAVGLLVSSFYSPTLAFTQVVLLSGLTTFSSIGVQGELEMAWDDLVPGMIGGGVAAIVAGRLRSREELALLGGGVGIVSGGVYLIMNLIVSVDPGAIVSAILPAAAFYGSFSMAWCVVALGLSPYLEKVFDLITPIRLAELSNPNRPLLKRLATEAPGTFQHTLFVASLAEAAARELHCNVELARAGTLYHDIGKMHDPLGFIENQMGGPNKHDEIDDPWQSAEIIKKHVSEGLAIARKYNLPQALCNFIPEHQGTILISYFYFQAQQRSPQTPEAQSPTISEADFRYAGPIPQSRETGIVMLADACEAALRSLKDVTPDVALATVKKIFKARWQDEQLVDSGLKKEELPIIADVFIRVWQQYNHQRIVYPKAALEPQPSHQ